jgi:hypothetical protein
MNCVNHPELPAVAFCRQCGKAMCQDCQRPALGSIYCEEHVPAEATAAAPPPLPSGYAGSAYASGSAAGSLPPRTDFPDSPYSAPVAPLVVADPGAHPVLALFLGFIPGVGAIYNGQYAKGLIHAVVFGLLVSLLSGNHNSGGSEAFLGIMLSAWVMYQAFEAYHTARKRRYGIAVDEFSSLFDVKPTGGKFPMGAIFMIGLGFVLLLDTTEIISFDRIARFWPVGLIVIGVYMLYNRMNPPAENGTPRSVDGGAR